jgi:hypothetical protein
MLTFFLDALADVDKFVDADAVLEMPRTIEAAFRMGLPSILINLCFKTVKMTWTKKILRWSNDQEENRA